MSGGQPGGEEIATGDSREQRADDEAVFPDLKLGDAWGESITTGRAAELEERLQAWEQEADHGERKGPRDGVESNGADVFWLAARTLAGTSDASAVVAQAELLHNKIGEERTYVRALFRLNLSRADLSHANLSSAYLLGAHLSSADLNEADLSRAELPMANLSDAVLAGANLSRAHLSVANLSGTNSAGMDLSEADLSSANLSRAFLSVANLSHAELTGANLSSANLSDANLSGAELNLANLSSAFLNRADLSSATLTRTNLSSADLRGARMTVETKLTDITLSSTTQLADIIWNNVPLSQVAWGTLPTVGDEATARSCRDADGKTKMAEQRLAEYEAAVRAYRLLAVTLRSQGLNEHADRYAYRAQVCQREVLRRQREPLRFLGSLVLEAIAGYGYRPLRTVFWYLAVIFGFAFVYHAVGPGVGVPLSPLGSLVFSITSFHGRGFFPGGSPGHSVTLDDPLTVMAAMEAVVGLFIEISFIATFTQRYFGK